ncbi:MAG TPA: divalent cation tolerance protein CutA, partial [Opitutus sp.]|nr:divalent cation tolerance protein CutA [Opitutus sp.]
MSAPSSPPPLFIAWTTVAQRTDADTLAAGAIAAGLAACVQIDGPIVSHYRWNGKAERAEEFRLTFKFLAEHAAALERHIHERHPYDTPEW